MNLETAQRCLNIAKGCHDYNGGNEGRDREMFHHGIQTVINCLEAFVSSKGVGDTQLNMVEAIGGFGGNHDRQEI